jgi:hypothetical protein
MQCCAFGCNKRKKSKTAELRSDSEGTSDEETTIKRQYDRTFHRYANCFVIKRQ